MSVIAATRREFFKKCRRSEWQLGLVGGLNELPTDWSNLDRLGATCIDDHVWFPPGPYVPKPWHQIHWRPELGQTQRARLEQDAHGDFNFVLRNSGTWPFSRCEDLSGQLGVIPWPHCLWVKGVWRNTNICTGAFFQCNLHCIVRRVCVIGLQIDCRDSDIFPGHGMWNAFIRLLNLNGDVVCSVLVGIDFTWREFIDAFRRQNSIEERDMKWFRFTCLFQYGHEYYGKVLHWQRMERSDGVFSFPDENIYICDTVDNALFRLKFDQHLFDDDDETILVDSSSSIAGEEPEADNVLEAEEPQADKSLEAEEPQADNVFKH